jgi:epoxyqueuosine reductase QueG
MKINWNQSRNKEDLTIPSDYLKHDSETQDRRELTFLMQEAAFAEHIPIYCTIDMAQLTEEEKKVFEKQKQKMNFEMKSIILLGIPIKELLLFMEQEVPQLQENRKETMAQLKVKNYLLDYEEKIQTLGYHTATAVPEILPNYEYSKMLAASKKGIVGKNGRYLTRDYGCRVCIGMVFSDIPLMGGDYRYEDYQENPCENCVKCVEACPVGALSDKGFDCQKCHTYRDDIKNQIQVAPHSYMKCFKCMEVCPIGG